MQSVRTTFPGFKLERRQVDVSVVQQLKHRRLTRSLNFVEASSVKMGVNPPPPPIPLAMPPPIFIPIPLMVPPLPIDPPRPLPCPYVVVAYGPTAYWPEAP